MDLGGGIGGWTSSRWIPFRSVKDTTKLHTYTQNGLDKVWQVQSSCHVGSMDWWPSLSRISYSIHNCRKCGTRMSWSRCRNATNTMSLHTDYYNTDTSWCGVWYRQIQHTLTMQNLPTSLVPSCLSSCTAPTYFLNWCFSSSVSLKTDIPTLVSLILAFIHDSHSSTAITNRPIALILSASLSCQARWVFFSSSISRRSAVDVSHSAPSIALQPPVLGCPQRSMKLTTTKHAGSKDLAWKGMSHWPVLVFNFIFSQHHGNHCLFEFTLKVEVKTMKILHSGTWLHLQEFNNCRILYAK